MKQTTICFYPSNQKRTNHFLFNLSRLLESNSGVKCIGYKDIKKENPKAIFGADVYHINWFDQSNNFVSFLKRLYFLIALKLKHKRIVWTIHNIVSHAKTPFYNKILFRLLVSFSDVIHIMCHETVPIAHLERVVGKVKYIPHGDYYGSYPESDFDVRANFGIEESCPLFLFSGAIQPYKNIEVLVKAFRKAFEGENSPKLLICGKVEPDSYNARISEVIGDSANIVFSPGFVPDDRLSAYIRAACVLVAPYSYRSALNSGTIPLAFSYGKTLVCPDVACVKEIQQACDCLYSYHYENEAEHVEVLSQRLRDAYGDFLDGKIKAREELAQRYMKENSWEAHRKEWLELYGVSAC